MTKRRLVIQVPEKLYCRLEQAAASSGLSPQAAAAVFLADAIEPATEEETQ